MLIPYKKVTYLYTVLETFEAGLVLTGVQVKLLRNNQVSLASPYIHNNAIVNVFETPIPLLLHKHEIRKLEEAQRIKHLTIVPLNIHTKKNRFKATIAIVRGKNKADKRESLKENAVKREMQ